MKRYNRLLPTVAIMLTLSACGGGGGNNNSTSAAAVQPAGELSQVAIQDANSEPDALLDAQGLADNITAIFGDANGTPTEVEAGDNTADVIDRAGG